MGKSINTFLRWSTGTPGVCHSTSYRSQDTKIPTYPNHGSIRIWCRHLGVTYILHHNNYTPATFRTVRAAPLIGDSLLYSTTDSAKKIQIRPSTVIALVSIAGSIAKLAQFLRTTYRGREQLPCYQWISWAKSFGCYHELASRFAQQVIMQSFKPTLHTPNRDFLRDFFNLAFLRGIDLCHLKWFCAIGATSWKISSWPSWSNLLNHFLRSDSLLQVFQWYRCR